MSSRQGHQYDCSQITFDEPKDGAGGQGGGGKERCASDLYREGGRVWGDVVKV